MLYIDECLFQITKERDTLLVHFFVIFFVLLQTNKKKETKKAPVQREQIITGPMVQIGFHWHADTPPIMIRVDQEQVTSYIVGLSLVSEQVSFLLVLSHYVLFF